MSVPADQLRSSWVRKIDVTHVGGVDIPGECWLWNGATDKNSGYGRVYVDHKCLHLHRVTYERFVGPIPDGLHIDHLCRQRSCCAPHHLEPVTCAENVRRGIRASQTHCVRGNHPLFGDNLYFGPPDKRGYQRRVCRTCRDEKMAAWKAARKVRLEATWSKYLTDEVAS